MHQTWAYRVDDPRFTPANEGKEPHTHAIMYQQVRQAYHPMAGKLGTGILPSGDAMYITDTDHSFAPAGLDPAYASFLRQTAHRAVAERKTGKH
ncbi:MAG: hypothetical protein JXM79_22850 [Sedimentisphaerales bacterium]|nr:hypothetical protein [Sedimentisphaerales bacterium]